MLSVFYIKRFLHENTQPISTEAFNLWWAISDSDAPNSDKGMETRPIIVLGITSHALSSCIIIIINKKAYMVM